MAKMNLGGHVQPLRNVAALHRLAIRLDERVYGLPGMACFHGWTGFGKTMAAAFVSNELQALYVRLHDTWTVKSLLRAILKELSLPARGTISELEDEVTTALAVAGRLLLVDEADYALKGRRPLIKTIRDLHDASDAPIILIGEEELPQKLRKWERVAGRMLDWVAAQPLDLRDAELLAGHYAPRLSIEAAVLKKIVEDNGGSARFVTTQIAHFQEQSDIQSFRRLDMAGYDRLPKHCIVAPQPRANAPLAVLPPALKVAQG
ncbi:MAG: ATP-binding protein [Pseudomonadota bacterium]